MPIVSLQESFEVGSEENLEQYNIWLPDDVLPGFRPFATDLFWKLYKTSMAILDAFIMSIDLNQQEAESLRKLHSGHNNQVRFLHYPPIPTEAFANKDLSRFFAHTDWRFVCTSILFLPYTFTFFPLQPSLANLRMDEL